MYLKSDNFEFNIHNTRYHSTIYIYIHTHTHTHTHTHARARTMWYQPRRAVFLNLHYAYHCFWARGMEEMEIQKDDKNLKIETNHKSHKVKQSHYRPEQAQRLPGG